MKQKYFKLLIRFFALCLITTHLYAENNESTPANLIRIMPLGDSITYDYRLSDANDPRPTSMRTGYRSHLWYMLQNAGYNADFVGSRIAGEGIIPPFDPDNEGHPGWTASELAINTYDYMINARPNIVLLHIGTNDTSPSIDGINAILNNIDFYERDSGQSVRVLIALPIGGKSAHEIKPFNDELEKLISQRAINGDNITLVDMYRTAGLTSSDFIDSIHPNDTGYRKMAQVWFNALMAPYTPALYTFPSTIVPSNYVRTMYVSEETKSVTFTTEVPDTGLIF